MLTPATPKLGRKYLLRPAPLDHHLLKVAPRLTARGLGVTAPKPVDHRHMLTPVRDQGGKGYCFAFATAALKEYNCARWSGYSHPIGSYLSPDYLGWRTQLAEGTFGEDSGATLPDAMEVLRAYGCSPESFLPYDSHNAAHAGNAAADIAARPYRIAMPLSVPVDADDWAAVLSAGHCIAVGFEVFASFEETGPDGVVPPVQHGEGLLGGHAVLCVGWEQRPEGRRFIIRNSWAANWGDGGYCYWPEAYLSHVFDSWASA